ATVRRYFERAGPASEAAALNCRVRGGVSRELMASSSVDLPVPGPPVRKKPLGEIARSWVPWKVPQLDTCTWTSRHCPGWGWSGSRSADWVGASVSRSEEH